MIGQFIRMFDILDCTPVISPFLIRYLEKNQDEKNRHNRSKSHTDKVLCFADFIIAYSARSNLFCPLKDSIHNSISRSSSRLASFACMFNEISSSHIVITIQPFFSNQSTKCSTGSTMTIWLVPVWFAFCPFWSFNPLTLFG